MSAAMGYAAQGGIGVNSTVDQRIDFRSESVGLIEEVINANGVRGTRSQSVEKIRQGLQRIGGTIDLQPTAVEWSYLLPWILGANASGTNYTLSDTLQARYVSFDRVTKVFTYDGCKVDRATIRCTQGQPLSLSLDVVGLTETIGNAGSFPNITLDTSTGPFTFADANGNMTVNGTTVTPRDWSITISNMLDRDRFFNSNTMASVETRDRSVMVSMTLPYGDQSALYGAGPTGVQMNVTFTNGATSLFVYCPALVFMRDSPNVSGKEEIMLPISGRAFKTGTTSELRMVLDSTP